MRSTADHLADADPGTPLATVDAVILEAIAEGATVDGELRQDLEALLARTLWYQGAHTALRDFVLTRAAQRAERLRGAVQPGPWASAFYRTGLPVRSCLALRDALSGHTADWDQSSSLASFTIRRSCQITGKGTGFACQRPPSSHSVSTANLPDDRGYHATCGGLTAMRAPGAAWPRVAGLLAGAAVTVLPEVASCGTRRPASRTPFREPG